MEEAAGGITFWVLAKVLRLTPKFNFESHTLRKINANAKNAPDEAFPNPLIAFSSSSQLRLSRRNARRWQTRRAACAAMSEGEIGLAEEERRASLSLFHSVVEALNLIFHVYRVAKLFALHRWAVGYRRICSLWPFFSISPFSPSFEAREKEAKN